MPAETYSSIFEDIIQSTKNDIILFLIVIVIAMILIALPAYVMYSKNRKEERKNNLMREENLMGVIKDNTEVITSLKYIIESNTKNTDDLYDITSSLGKMMLEVKMMSNDLIQKMSDIYKDSSEIVNSVKDIEIPKIRHIKESNIRIEGKLEEIDNKLNQICEEIKNKQ